MEKIKQGNGTRGAVLESGIKEDLSKLIELDTRMMRKSWS